jgi:hypothetical protein
LRRSSFAELCAPAGLEVVCEDAGLVCCAQLPTGIASSADAAIAVVQLAVERFIAWLLPEQMLKSFPERNRAIEVPRRAQREARPDSTCETVNDLWSGFVES